MLTLIIALLVLEHELGDMVDRRIADFSDACVFMHHVANVAVWTWTGCFDAVAQNIVYLDKPSV